jgi:hypothetical protein
VGAIKIRSFDEIKQDVDAQRRIERLGDGD